VTNFEQIISRKTLMKRQLDELLIKIWNYLTKAERRRIVHFQKEPTYYYYRSARYYRILLQQKPKMLKTLKRLLRRYIAHEEALRKTQYVYVQSLFWL